MGTGEQLARGTDILFAGHSFGHKNCEADLEDIANRAIEYFRLAEQVAPVETGELPVIFTPDGLLALLISLGLAIDGRSVSLGASPLPDKLGKQIASPSLSIVDDPFIDYGPRTGAFDDEVVTRKVTPIIEKGFPRNLIYDLNTAGREGVKPTGRGSSRSLTNLVIEPGKIPCETMIKNTSLSLLVENFWAWVKAIPSMEGSR